MNRTKKITEVEQFYSIEEVAEKIGVSAYTVRRRLNQYIATKGAAGLGPAYFFGRKTLRFKASDVARYMENCKSTLDYSNVAGVKQ